ncbi:hypothetical protein Mesau_02625 [Mesorhizobium australicum WSM2073]|uniref:Uncharacterized protein n=1 Tax=Mesorhizobium australicum (strain HAMBI 3006 / LMG 24608 / WSM2073) TaxID=754035 RepID=L0KKF4_MESAW|nr:hypothetical protein Mesau_02625 [Mesorhizobium australicum WSM2073]
MNNFCARAGKLTMTAIIPGDTDRQQARDLHAIGLP